MPFGGTPVPAQDAKAMLSIPLFEDVDADAFPDTSPLSGIIANDTRLVRYSKGDVVYRAGEYGTSVFVVLRGNVKSLMPVRSSERTKPVARIGSLLRALTALRQTALRNEVVDLDPSLKPGVCSPPVLSLGRYDLFGILGAFSRSPRTASVMVEDDDTLLLELRWPALRELMHWSDPFRERMQEQYRQWGLWSCLQGSSLFANVDDRTLLQIAENATFECYGDVDWTHRFQKSTSSANGHVPVIEQEPIIAEQDHYLDGLLLVHSGTIRVTERLGHEERTTGYVTKNSVIGLPQILGTAEGQGDLKFPNSFRAVGYADLVRIPTQVVAAHVLPDLPESYACKARATLGSAKPSTRAGLPRSYTEFFVDNRYTNGAMAMAINTERCVNCDDCVRACAAAHDGVARFARKGPTHHNLMVAQACMHCFDPVCLVDCPTGAIHRDKVSGTVVIDEATCIGCAACAKACPYDNIQMADVRNPGGAFLVDEDGVQIQRAEKCDLCAGRKGGPACERACPHEALARVDLRDMNGLSEWLCATSYDTAC